MRIAPSITPTGNEEGFDEIGILGHHDALFPLGAFDDFRIRSSVASRQLHGVDGNILEP